MNSEPLTLASLPGGLVTEEHLVAGHRFRLTRPKDPDRLLDLPAVREANRHDDYMPYWGYLWPAGRLLAEAVLTRPLPPGDRAIELGCGVGLAGLAALAMGKRVTFSDYDPTSLELAAHNARQNGFNRFDTLLLDWRQPNAEPYPFVLGADLLYEARNHAPLAALLATLLDPHGSAWFTDPGREVSSAFFRLLRDRFVCNRLVLSSKEETGSSVGGHLYVIK